MSIYRKDDLFHCAWCDEPADFTIEDAAAPLPPANEIGDIHLQVICWSCGNISWMQQYANGKFLCVTDRRLLTSPTTFRNCSDYDIEEVKIL